jgi:hypothetical protein
MKLLHTITEEREVWRNELRHDEVLKRCSSYELHSLENAFNDTRFRHTLLISSFLASTSLPPPSGSLMHFLKDCNSRQALLRGDRRPTEEEMMRQFENDAEIVIHQEV